VQSYMLFFHFILFSKVYVSINFYYKLILINKLIKQNRVNNLYCTIKYLNLYLSFNFYNFVFIYRQFPFSIKLYWPHDIGHTIDMSSWHISYPSHVFCVLTQLYQEQYFSLLRYFLLYYEINQNLTWLSNSSCLFKNMNVFFFGLKHLT